MILCIDEFDTFTESLLLSRIVSLLVDQLDFLKLISRVHEIVVYYQ